MRVLMAAIVTLASARSATAQDFTYRGFAELRSIVYPQTTPQDDDHVALEERVRLDAAYKPAPWLTLAGSVEERLDNIGQVRRTWQIDWAERNIRRSAIGARQAVATLRRGPIALDLGKQFIRWGKADILNPTDRFAPRDFMEVTDDEFLAVTGTRARYETGAHSIDVVWVPIFTPSRIPLLGRRWAAPLPQTAVPVPIVERDPAFPDRSQYGARWNVVGSGFELSASYFDGFNHLPQFTSDLPNPSAAQPFVALRRSYAPLRSAGADAAVPLPWFTVKGEAAYFNTTSLTADDVVLYVVQIERQSGELSVVGGYAGEVVTTRRSAFEFSPERGLTRAFLGRAACTLDAAREVSVEAAVRQNGDGAWVKAVYSHARGAHWRVIVGGAIIAGKATDFFGQYRRNSHGTATLRYSF
jgi:hypothetical protein